MISLVRRVGHRDNKFLRSAFDKRVGDIEAERGETSSMLSEELTVEPDRCFMIDSTEVQDQPFAGQCRGFEAPAIPDALFGCYRVLHPAQRRLDGEGDNDLTIVTVRLSV